MPVSNRTKIARLHPDTNLAEYLFTEDGKVYRRVDGGQVNPDGYLTLDVPSNDGRKTRTVHRLILETFVGERPNGAVCRHIDGDRRNNAVSNLCWGTPKENSDDRERHGNHCHGERSGMAKLTDESVRDVWKLHRLGVSGAEIARIMGVKKETIYLIINKKTWRHITE